MTMPNGRLPLAIAVNEMALREIAERFKLAFIALFGSGAKGRLMKESDLDTAVWAEQLPDDESDLADWAMALAEELADAIPHGEGLDLVVLNRAESLLMFQVARHGIVLYERVTGAWRQFKSYAARRYDDDAKFRRRLSAYLQRRYGR